MTLPKLVRLSDIPDHDPGADVAERSYRRGCHQAAGLIAREIEDMESIREAVTFLNGLTDILGELRQDQKPHPTLLHDAIAQAKRRTRP
ncbi:MAG: hypothetical protein A3F84_25150 [Candidatus Handelsmanbacteria bacterium RIFCSPLOWO2_12_FULL_64_10]|uniref:Uncharacterized protein n=1 Tax=Handelsmanbacteria sp. (strain RIFCSPLOWO2_12_FULL_64_10) TaxID=1817868 RepID=A0A1F6CCG8_HANXR|nr:MAG: hypothetical protein A3F84_25150 [Candidatus Handelsmanbacteria bacterium RIFCSPLOWO2_12_FULL_64_10]